MLVIQNFAFCKIGILVYHENKETKGNDTNQSFKIKAIIHSHIMFMTESLKAGFFSPK